MSDEFREKADLDDWIVNGDKELDTTSRRMFKKHQNPILFQISDPVQAARERRQRHEYAMREAGRTHEANQARYKQRILDEMPIMNGVQRVPATWAEFDKRVQVAYHKVAPELLFDLDDWRKARVDAQDFLVGNQAVVVSAYASEMRRRMASGQHNLKEMWQEIAHHADRDDAQLKAEIWTELKQSGGITPPLGI